jgi:metal-responsive CopG/Arc/MetJ family transcriptional regulator
MQLGITKSMKTAVSVDDALMEQADQAARDLGLSRSALVAEALRAFLRLRRQAQITEQLNRVYADEPSPAERRLVRKLKTKLPVRDAW